MVGSGFLDEGFGFREGVSGGYATGDVRQVCGVAGGRLLDDGGVFHDHSQWGCERGSGVQ